MVRETTGHGPRAKRTFMIALLTTTLVLAYPASAMAASIVTGGGQHINSTVYWETPRYNNYEWNRMTSKLSTAILIYPTLNARSALSSAASVRGKATPGSTGTTVNFKRTNDGSRKIAGGVFYLTSYMPGDCGCASNPIWTWETTLTWNEPQTYD